MQSECPTDKFFEIKILTPKPLGLKILRGILAKPAPDKAFTGLGGRGVPSRPPGIPISELVSECARRLAIKFFSWISTGRALAQKLLRDPTIQINRFV